LAVVEAAALLLADLAAAVEALVVAVEAVEDKQEAVLLVAAVVAVRLEVRGLLEEPLL
jgi:hypothetical protein